MPPPDSPSDRPREADAPPAPRAIARRRALRFGAAGVLSLVGAVAGGPARARGSRDRAVAADAPARRSLRIASAHTGERYAGTYWSDGLYDGAELERLAHLMRDHRTGETHPIDTDLVDQLAALQRRLDAPAPLVLISGYRSPATNEALRQRSSGVARSSYHLSGRAADVRVGGVAFEALHREALALGAGGVGAYSGSGFVHLDTGPVRTWGG